MVVTVHGTVIATMAGMTVPLSAGAILQLPATVRTGATQEDSTTIALFEGHLEVRASDDSDVVDLDAGEIAIRRRNGAARAVRA